MSCWSGEAMVHLSVRETDVNASKTRTKCSCGTSYRQQAGEEGKYMHVNNCNLQSSLRLAAGMQDCDEKESAKERVGKKRAQQQQQQSLYYSWNDFNLRFTRQSRRTDGRGKSTALDSRSHVSETTSLTAW